MEKIKLTEKEVEYLNDFVKMGLKLAREFDLAIHFALVNDGKRKMEIKIRCGSAGQPFPTPRRNTA
ncbi:MAG: hypothetical protein AEth_00980 [Candidatus Argoarchaeum ethanivorans]|uniref:Uncharacterized protein n=1 Tax=Candidatus Argoarchaeum ethanivorans TaxID=2608793 RepID=A0A8B3S265_9EURY|nr:MAG: hypothetical protein AEth_00980 [Candidatus Argoarchaeum ethanivorans]